MKKPKSKTVSFDNIANQLYIQDDNLPPFRVMERIEFLEKKIDNISKNLILEEMKELLDLYSVCL
ncbi:hypothetical protein GW835_04550 [archaeon]|nr:hypothetical protein [archaeon]